MDKTMRDKMETILSDHNPNQGRGWDPSGGGYTTEEAIDLILAALPDMVQPLVWVDDRHGRLVSGNYSITAYEHKFLVMFRGLVINPNGSESEISAKAAADAHHRATIMAAFGEVSNG